MGVMGGFLPARELFTSISAKDAGSNVVVQGSGGLRIRVVKYTLSPGGPVVVTWESSKAGAISGPMPISPEGGGLDSGYCPAGLMQTAFGEDLTLNLSSAVSVGGMLTYVLTP